MRATKDLIIEEVNKIIAIRKIPVVILSLDPVNKFCALKLYNILCKHEQFDELDVILQTGGGEIDPAYAMLKILKQSTKKLNIIVPLYAKSAGTLMCIGADELLMTSISELGPLDTQIRETDRHSYVSALNEFKALERVQYHCIETLDVTSKMILALAQKVQSPVRVKEAIRLAINHTGITSGKMYDKVEPKTIGRYARALEIGVNYGNTILTRIMGWDREAANEVIQKLVYSYPSHGYIIDIDELRSLGFPVKEIVKENEFFELVLKIRDLLLKFSDFEEQLIEIVLPVKEALKAEQKEVLKEVLKETPSEELQMPTQT